MSKKNLEHLEGLEKKEVTHERVASVIVDGVMKHYDTNLHKFDVVAVKSRYGHFQRKIIDLPEGYLIRCLYCLYKAITELSTVCSMDR